MNRWTTGLVMMVCCVCSAAAGPRLELLRASYFGTAENDDLQSACAGPDGTVYLAGNVGTTVENLPGGIEVMRLGKAAATPRCGRGLVVRLDADGSNVLACAEFGKGLVSVTTVQWGKQGVYVAGYADEALEQILKDVPGLIKTYPLRKQVEAIKAGKWIVAPSET